MKVFAERLKDLRTEHGMTVAQLGKEIGYSHVAVLRWESDTRTPNIEALVAIANYFKVSTDYLCGLED